MGCFGYLCKGCGKQIVGDSCDGGELCVLIHVRHGEEIGRTIGHYDEYGGVKEDDVWRKDDGENSHEELYRSELGLDDSYNAVKDRRMYNGEECSYYSYISKIVKEELEKCNCDISQSRISNIMSESDLDRYNKEYYRLIKCKDKMDMSRIQNRLKQELEILLENSQGYWEMHKEFMQLPEPELETYSGIAAWHKKCYDESDNKEDMTPSRFDPNQSWGEPKKEFI